MIGYFSRKSGFGARSGKPCPKCGVFVERLKDGRPYNDDGTWHEEKNGSCRPSREYQEKQKLERAEWEAKNLIKPEDRKEIRSNTPLYMRGREA